MTHISTEDPIPLHTLLTTSPSLQRDFGISLDPDFYLAYEIPQQQAPTLPNIIDIPVSVKETSMPERYYDPDQYLTRPSGDIYDTHH